MDVNAFKAQWKYLLKERGLTQDKLAIELYVDSSLISKWVNGREPFPDWAKRRITQLLRLSEEETADLFSSLVHGLNRQEEDGLPSAKIMADFSQMPEPEFLSRLLLDYEGCLDRFFDQKTGAVREHLRDDGSPAFLYSEVTGYAIHDLVILYEITGNTEYLAKAQKAGNWLINSATHPSGWIHPRFYFEKDSDPSLSLYSFAGGNFFAFDNGICLSGLIDLYQVTRDIAIYQRAKTLADNFVKLVKADGSICAIFDAQGQEIQVPQPRWSQQSRSFHTKIAAALADMNSIDPNEKYIETARSMCHHAMTFQAEDGRFITDEYGNTQLHPHCYSAEGLLHVGLALDELAFIESAYRATAWAIDQMRDGEIPQEISSTGIVNWYPRTDALAQVLSLGARFQQLGILKESRWEALNNLMTCLLSKKDPEEKLFQFGTYENGQAAHTVNYWTNMFAFHSLLEYLAAWVCQNSVLVILAGGIGSRCWPISCENMPKPLSKGFLGDRSLLEETAGRFLRTGCVLPQNIVVVVSPTGLDEARRQLQKLKIPPENLVLEQVAKGTMGAVRLANKTMLSMAKAATIISMADDLIEPTSALRDALIRAVIACLTSDQDVIVSLGVPSDTQDPRYGHAIYNPQNTIIPQVYHVDRFVEKPKEPLHLLENECFSWEGGCVITKSYYLQELLRKPQHPDLAEREDISYGLLENPQVHKGTALFSPKVRFMDFGVPDDNLREFFLGSDADRGNGNIVLGPSNSEVVFIDAMRNLVVSDRLSVEVIGISDHLIIDNSYTNSAVVIPLEKVDELPTLYRMLENPQNLHPYIAGGESAWKALPHHITYECQGHCEITSSYGLAFAAYSTNLRMTRGEHGLKVVDTSFTNLTDFDIDILMKKKSDPRLIQHLIDVTVIAEALADSVNLSPEGKELLHRLCLLHDYGGFLDDEHLQAEKEIILMMQNVSGLDWRVIDPQVMKKLVLINSETSLTEIQQRVLTKFNDSINSALEALDIPDIRSYKYLNELLFCLCNHDRPDMFRRPYTSKFTMLLADLESVIACCVIADIWAKTHSLWKYQLRDHELTQKKEDIGGTAAFICNYLTRAGLDPAIWIRHLNRLMLNASTPLFYYTCNKLRILVRWQGLTEQVPLYGSDNVYLAFTACDRGSHQLDDKVRQAIELALVSGENFDKKLLLRLPANLSKLAEHRVVNRSLVEDLAQEIMRQFRQRERRLWEEDEEGRSSLLQVLNQ